MMMISYRRGLVDSNGLELPIFARCLDLFAAESAEQNYCGMHEIQVQSKLIGLGLLIHVIHFLIRTENVLNGEYKKTFKWPSEPYFIFSPSPGRWKDEIFRWTQLCGRNGFDSLKIFSWIREKLFAFSGGNPSFSIIRSFAKKHTRSLFSISSDENRFAENYVWLNICAMKWLPIICSIARR